MGWKEGRFLMVVCLNCGCSCIGKVARAGLKVPGNGISVMLKRGLFKSISVLFISNQKWLKTELKH